MTKMDEFFAKEGGVKSLHSKMPLPDAIKEKMNEAAFRSLPQWVKDLKSNQEEKSLVNGFVDGRMTALSIGKKEMLDAFATKFGFEYETPKSKVIFNAMDKGYDR